MFTGLITDLGELIDRQQAGDNLRLTIATSYDTSDLQIGESIAIDGACMTVDHLGNDHFQIDASPETLELTTLGDLSVGDPVHLERALRLSDRLGGHVVTGHIDGIGEVRETRELDDAWRLTIDAPERVALFLITKGSIAIDGVSMTVNHVDGQRFQLMVIPHTSQKTKLTDYQVGQKVNLEADLLGKYVHKFVSPEHRRVTLNDLIYDGFP